LYPVVDLAPPTSERDSVGVESPATSAREWPRLVAADVAAGSAAALVDWRLGLLAAVLVVPATTVAGLQRRRFTLSVLDETPRILRATTLLVAFLVAGSATVGGSLGSALSAGLLIAPALLGIRAVAYRSIRAGRRNGRSVHPVVLAGPASADIARRIEQHPETGLRVVGTADSSGKVHLVEGGTAPISSVIEARGVRDLVLDHAGEIETSSWVRNLAWRDLSVHVVLPQVGATPVRGWDDHIWGVPLLRMQSSLRWRRTRSMKRLTDVVVAGGALLVLMPLLVVVALLVRREVGPNIIFRQQRVGIDGRLFDVLKFRSMRDLPPGQVSPWSVTSSDRIGPVGRVMRKYSIDELPQLWNILRGDMSLVGPRPERPEYVAEFSSLLPIYGTRHRAPVGLTGLAAVEGLRGDTSIEDRAYFDNLYVDSWTFWGDVKIVARTVSAVLRGTGS
jgi:exopolysaccharide biosynthesis polyprenyl glycosylphosphotransferase